MSLVVQKFGGTSVADSRKILAAARRAIQARLQGKRVLVVVSARGHTTDELIALALEINERPPAREMDMLLSTGEQVSVALMAMAIEAGGAPAISFTGAQIGIVTDSFHTKARIKNIDTRRVEEALAAGKVVIVAGFQGVDENYNITTLGRGGSDTTAVALAAVLGAEVCEIYTDVDGVFTTDPRLVPEARKIDRISFDEMLELASLGAGVMHSRSIEFAKKYGVPIHVRNSMSEAGGTWIVGEVDARRLGIPVCGAAIARDEARITVHGVRDRPGNVHALFRAIADANIVVDMIVQNVATDGLADVSFTVASGDLAETLLATESAARTIGARGVTHDPNVSKVSVVGLGMRTHPGVAARLFEAIGSAGINLQMITTSEIKISALVDRSSGPDALRAAHRAFELEREFADTPAGAFKPRGREEGSGASGDEVLLADVSGGGDAGMEDLVISGVELDETQARVTLFGVPDRPGYAGEVFRRIGEANVNVDMIVQNPGREGAANLSFTVPRRCLDAARAAAEAIHGEIGSIAVEPAIDKLSVLGLGMRSHAEVAVRMFSALAGAGINLSMINTSEVRINVATEAGRGREGLEILRRAFDLPGGD